MSSNCTLLLQWQLPGARTCAGDVEGRQLGWLGSPRRRGAQQRLCQEETPSIALDSSRVGTGQAQARLPDIWQADK